MSQRAKFAYGAYALCWVDVAAAVVLQKPTYGYLSQGWLALAFLLWAFDHDAPAKPEARV